MNIVLSLRSNGSAGLCSDRLGDWGLLLQIEAVFLDLDVINRSALGRVRLELPSYSSFGWVGPLLF